jgi:hypothetical protein
MIDRIPDRSVDANERRKRKKLGDIWFERSIITSPAWLALPSAAACQVYLLFLGKRKMEKTKRRGGKWICTNWDKLVFPYRAAQKLGITSPRFQRTIDSLIEFGFIDIAEPGNGTARECTKYALSERWQNYGKPTFEKQERVRAKKGGSKHPFVPSIESRK